MMIYLQNPKGLFSSHQKGCLSAHPYDHRKENAYQESFPQLQNISIRVSQSYAARNQLAT